MIGETSVRPSVEVGDTRRRHTRSYTYTRSKLCRHRTDSQHRESGTLSTREVTRDSDCTTPIRRVAHGTHNVLYGPCSLRFSSPSRRAARRPPLRAHATLHTRASAAPAGASPVAIFIATSRSKLRPCVLTLTHGLSYTHALVCHMGCRTSTAPTIQPFSSRRSLPMRWNSRTSTASCAQQRGAS